jgi:hypothetical protein
MGPDRYTRTIGSIRGVRPPVTNSYPDAFADSYPISYADSEQVPDAGMEKWGLLRHLDRIGVLNRVKAEAASRSTSSSLDPAAASSFDECTAEYQRGDVQQRQEQVRTALQCGSVGLSGLSSNDAEHDSAGAGENAGGRG